MNERVKGSTRGLSTEPKNGIRAIPIAFSVLDALTMLGRPAQLGEIASLAELTPSRAHRYLAGLAEVGLVRQSRSTGLYDVGEKLTEFGLRALSRTDPVSIGREVVAKLSNETGIDSHMTVWGTNGPTIMRWQQGHNEYAIKVPEGANMSLLNTATGRIFLTFMPEKQTAPILKKEIEEWNADRNEDQRIESLHIANIKDAIKLNGVAVAIGSGKQGAIELTSPTFHRSSDRGIAAIAAPVFNSSGMCMAITLIGVVGGFDTSIDGEPALALRRHAEQCSRRLGAKIPGVVIPEHSHHVG